MNMSTLGQKISSRLARHFPSGSVRAPHFGPIVSFTFDDAPPSAATTGAEILEEFDVRGTYYLSGGWLGRFGDIQPLMTADQARGLALRRHEIGCHTFNHTDVCGQDWSMLQADLDENRRIDAFGEVMRPRQPNISLLLPRKSA